MPRGWDSYFVEIEGRTASIFCDLDPPSAKVTSSLPCVLCIRIALHSPGEHGLTTDEEFNALSTLEDHLEAIVTEQLRGRYVGRYTHNGRRTFFVYVPDANPDQSRIANSLTDLGYPPELWAEPDSSWQKYSWLYPSTEELQTIEDRRTLEALAKEGDDHSIPRDVDHWIYFESAADRSSFINDVVGQGFEIRSQWDNAEVPRRPYGLQVFRRHPVDFDSLASVVRDLLRRAERHSGDYDGWETSVEKPSRGAA